MSLSRWEDDDTAATKHRDSYSSLFNSIVRQHTHTHTFGDSFSLFKQTVNLDYGDRQWVSAGKSWFSDSLSVAHWGVNI